MKSYKVTFADGTQDVISTSPLGVIAHRYGVDELDLVESEDDADRTLVWLDEESAENDDVANAVAQFSPVK